jgi:hypothetical protein
VDPWMGVPDADEPPGAVDVVARTVRGLSW